MGNLTAANAERLARALDKRYLGGSVTGYNVTDLLEEDRIAYVRLGDVLATLDNHVLMGEAAA